LRFPPDHIAKRLKQKGWDEGVKWQDIDKKTIFRKLTDKGEIFLIMVWREKGMALGERILLFGYLQPPQEEIDWRPTETIPEDYY
jgi:hypothetical protein